eukprot:UN03981
MDSWSDIQLEAMKAGGNAQLLQFLARSGLPKQSILPRKIRQRCHGSIPSIHKSAVERSESVISEAYWLPKARPESPRTEDELSWQCNLERPDGRYGKFPIRTEACEPRRFFCRADWFHWYDDKQHWFFCWKRSFKDT